MPRKPKRSSDFPTSDSGLPFPTSDSPDSSTHLDTNDSLGNPVTMYYTDDPLVLIFDWGHTQGERAPKPSSDGLSVFPTSGLSDL